MALWPKVVAFAHLMQKDKVEHLNEDLENRVEQRTRQVQQANKDLRAEIAERIEAEEKYKTLFERSKDGVFITSTDGRFVDLNPAGIELFGYANRDEILGVDIAKEYIYPRPRVCVQQSERHGCFFPGRSVTCERLHAIR